MRIYSKALLGLVCALAASAKAGGLDDLHWRNPWPQANDLRGVTYASNTFVAVGDAGAVITSADGLNWSNQDSFTREALLE